MKELPHDTSPTTALSPKAALLLGSLADSASTYAFLKRGNGQREGNPALGFFDEHPASVIPTAAAGALGYRAAYDLLHKHAPRVADTVAGLVGGFHGALAGNNIENTRGEATRQASDDLAVPSPRKR
jgi:hypothetical protein